MISTELNHIPFQISTYNAKKRLMLSCGICALVILFLIFGLLTSFVLSFLLGLGTILFILAFVRPYWTLILIMWYTPFEPFLLKFVPEEYYYYVRFASEVIIYILLISILLRIFAKKIEWRLTKFDFVFALFILTTLVSTILFWPGMSISIFGWRGIVRFMLLFYVGFYLAPSRKQILFALTGLGIIFLFESSLGIIQFVTQGILDSFLAPTDTKTLGDITVTVGTLQIWLPGQRVFATLGRYEQFGTWLMILLLMLFAALYEKFSKRQKQLIFLVFTLGCTALLLTYSRTSWFGFILGAGFIGVIMKRDKRLVYGAILLITAIFIYQQISGVVVNKLYDRPYAHISIIERILESFSYERWRGEYRGYGRLFFIVETPRKVMSLSPIFGFGPGQYGSGAAAAFHNTRVYDMAGIPFGIWGIYGHIDNSWLSLWGETGTVGLSLYILFFLFLFHSSYQVYKKSKYTVTRFLALGYMGIILSVTFASFLATFMEMRTLALYFWLFGGFVVALGYRENLFLKK